ncbi:LysR substrate-binding domain-containing protein [Cognatishimia sp. WU-CL00825]|uniref:LysR family transcriptional regulator n=1 Tax=Cognatishimia sp. WU-CL00825 TaxID=3127658 RepID=UPI003106107A
MAAHWDDLKTVMHLVRGGSLAAAADALDVSYTTVARRVKRAEEDLGLQLFDRLADGYQATAAGERVAEKASAMEMEELDLMRGLVSEDPTLSGSLTVTAPQLVCSQMLLPVFQEFTEKYPEVELHIRADAQLLDLNRREADIAIRVSNEPGDSLTGRRLASQKCLAYGTQKWADLIAEGSNAEVSWIAPERIPAAFKDFVPDLGNAKVCLRSDDMITMIEAARAGMGVLCLPVSLGRSYSDLVQLPLLPPLPFPDIWAVAHRDIWRSARVTAFREILFAHFKSTEALFRLSETESPRG